MAPCCILISGLKDWVSHRDISPLSCRFSKLVNHELYSKIMAILKPGTGNRRMERGMEREKPESLKHGIFKIIIELLFEIIE